MAYKSRFQKRRDCVNVLIAFLLIFLAIGIVTGEVLYVKFQVVKTHC